MASAVTLEVRGLDALIRRIDQAPVREQANIALTKGTKAVHRRLSTYTQTDPPRRPQQTYIRTFTLKESIHFSVKPFGTSGEGRIFTALPYAPPVMGHADQTWVFAGRWWTEKSVAEEMMPVVINYFVEGMGKVAHAIAGGVI